jgi:O-acetyl-ADP-ribose deacetylase (regulator of RNase III)
VKSLGSDKDPVQVIVERTREKIVAALDAGWNGPPYDLVELATNYLGLDVIATDTVREARTVPVGRSARIEFNPNRPRERRRFSIAHEIAHTIFPDYADRVRHRGSNHPDQPATDEWQLEALCNIAAAEILMPIGSLPDISRDTLTIDALRKLRPQYDVSMEAVLIRAVGMADFPSAVYTASRIESGAREGRYRIDYIISSHGWIPPIKVQTVLPENTHVGDCTAIGYTAKGNETWGTEHVHLECVGIPPYPWSVFPRVAGIMVAPKTDATHEKARIQFVVGDALEPRGKGPKIIAHIVNSSTPNWGGRGFAFALRREMPDVQDAFRDWAAPRGRLNLGNVHFAKHGNEVVVASMIAQRGYGEVTGERRVRYGALESCLDQVAEHARQIGATVHMPRIGTGQGGAAWPLVQEMINRALSDRGIAVTVYDLVHVVASPQQSLSFMAQ